MKTEYTHDEWLAEAKLRFGDNPMNWAFVCPSCGHVATIEDWKNTDAPDGAIAFSCVGRYGRQPAGEAFVKSTGLPCNYAGGGLFGLNPIAVAFDDGTVKMFAFADMGAKGGE